MEITQISYTKEEVIDKLTTEFGGDRLAADVIASKYLLRDGDVYLENSYEMVCRRLAKIIYANSKGYEKFIESEEQLFDLFNKKQLVFGGRVTAGLGSKELTSLSNCFVIEGPDDSYEDILRADCEQVQLMKRGGGVGMDLSKLRKKGSKVNNAAKTSTGAVSFMPRYSNTTLEVAQEGRRGALMLMIDGNHGDTEEFITSKLDLSKINGANISVRVDDKFMHTAITDIDSDESRKLNAIALAMWKSAEPGIIFWDTMRNCPWTAIGVDIKGTNPCGEIPLPAYESCRLLHVNLFACEDFYKTVFIANVINDIIVTLEIDGTYRIMRTLDKKSLEYKLWHKIRTNAIDYRNIGIGITGLADYLNKVGLKYSNVDEHLRLAKILKKASYEASIEMARELGAPPGLVNEREVLDSFIIPYVSEEHYKMFLQYGKRNITNNTIAPVGTGSLLTQTTSGIEPLFEPAYYRKRRGVEGEPEWVEYLVIHKPIQDLTAGIKFESVESVAAYVKRYTKYETAKEIDPINKMQVQQAWQMYIDNSISVTYNLPAETTSEQIREYIIEAFKRGLKGFTVYREGSRDGVLKSLHEKKPNVAIIDRPVELECDIHGVKIQGENWIVIIGLMDDKPYEIFALKVTSILIKEGKGKLVKNTGEKTTYDFISNCVDVYDIISHYETGNEQVTTKLVSRALRMGTPISSICNDFIKVDAVIGTFENVLLRVLSKYNIDEKTGEYVRCVSCQ